MSNEMKKILIWNSLAFLIVCILSIYFTKNNHDGYTPMIAFFLLYSLQMFLNIIIGTALSIWKEGDLGKKMALFGLCSLLIGLGFCTFSIFNHR
jgi:hypothetical protein